MPTPITLYLIGHAGSGKLTIAKEFLGDGYLLLDNHLINNPIFSLLNLKPEERIPALAWGAISQIRNAVLSFIAEDKKHSFVLTNVLLDADCDYRIYDLVQQTAARRHSLFVPVILTLSEKENRHRVTQVERKSRLKDTVFRPDDYQKELIKIDHPNLLRLDVTDLSPKEAQAKIMGHIKNLSS